MTYQQSILALVFVFASSLGAVAFEPPAKSQNPTEQIPASNVSARRVPPSEQVKVISVIVSETPKGQTEKQSQRDFLADFIKATRNTSGQRQNVVASPFGATSIGEMLYWGAAGSTRDALAEAFLPGTDPKETPDWPSIDKANAEKMPYVSVNGIWYQKDFSFLPTYTGKLQERFSPEVAAADFAGQADKECDKINTWVGRATNGHVEKLFGQLDANTRLVLANAICFQGKWASPFEIENTAVGDFRCSAKKNVQVSYMNAKRRFSYGESDTFQCLEIPYEMNNCSMLIILPKEEKRLWAVETSLTTQAIDQIRGEMMLTSVDCRLPKFAFETEIDLKAVFTKLGAGIIFDQSKADFSGMDGSGQLVVDQAVQKVFIRVDESGTEAVAASGAAVGLKSAPLREEEPKTFHATRPFFFMIRDNVNNITLFVGRVIDPS